MQDRMAAINRIGYCLNGKEEKANAVWQFDKMSTVFAEYGYTLVPLDIDLDWDRQGPFVAIIHKAFGIDDQSNIKSTERTIQFEKYLERHPEVIVFDTPSSVRKASDRVQQLQTLTSCLLMSQLSDSAFVPTFVHLETSDVAESVCQLKQNGVTFPVVCKPVNGQGVGSHKMALVFNEKGLAKVNMPCVAQSFVNHNARLFKLFVLGKQYFVSERPSIKNFTSESQVDVIEFNTSEVSKSHSCSELIKLDDADKPSPWFEPDANIFDRLAQEIPAAFGLTFLGIDVILDKQTGRHAIIDVNFLPGYRCSQKGTEQVQQMVCQAIHEKIEKVHCQKTIF